MSQQRVAITTGGGDAPGLNAVIRAIVKTGMSRFNMEFVGIEDGFEGLVNTRRVIKLNRDAVRGILPKGGTILGSTNRGNPFEYEVTSVDGEKRISDLSDRCMENFESLELSALIAIGGDGTMHIAQRFSEKGMPIIGVPKTIDNDLLATDVTFGFNTAVTVATEAIDRLHSTAESHGRTMVLEVMGRDAGWIALEAGIAGGADLILMPEIPYDLDDALRFIKRRYARGSNFSIAVVAEAASNQDHPDDKIHRRRTSDTPGVWFSEMVRKHLGVEVRHTILGHLQRGGSPTCIDRMLGTRFGVHAAELVADKQFGRMVALNGTQVVNVPIEDAIGRQKFVDPDGQLIRTAESLGIYCGRPMAW
jgi:ATP-dependent phosphofructokinase / diphosphate-dependent phosphofructokinase